MFHAGTLYGLRASSSHGISEAFAKKMMGFPSDLVSFSTKLSSKRHEKNFYRVLIPVQIHTHPVKNVTWILMEIPYHFLSQINDSFSSKLTPNSMKIPCHLARFYLFSMLKYDMNFRQVMEFPWHLLRK